MQTQEIIRRHSIRSGRIKTCTSRESIRYRKRAQNAEKKGRGIDRGAKSITEEGYEIIRAVK